MLGIIYCLLAILIGKEVAGMFFVSENRNKSTRTNQFWILASGALGTGLLIFGWITYMISWAASALGAEKPLIYGNLAVMAGAAVFLALLYGRRYRKENSILSEYEQALIHDKKQFRKELILLVILAVFLTWIMFYVFYIKDGVLYSGYTVYGDYAPHTAMMRSFSLGNNFPTQYPHFGGQDVKYHFMFQFLVGNLEFLGLRLDFAYNIVSILALLAFLMMLYNLALRITGSFAASVMTIVFFFFRSALTFFHFVLEHLQAGDLMETFRNNMNFIGYTPNENWGLWNFNVYLNQRHLAFGLLIVTLALWMFLEWVDAGCAHEEKGWNWLTGRIFSREAWKSRNLENALMAGMMLGLTSFWNGAAVIGGLLILFGFAAFSDGKLDYLVTAIAAVVFAELQAKVFYLGRCGKYFVLLGISGRGQITARGTVVPFADERSFFSWRTGTSVFPERPQTESASDKFSLSVDFRILYFADTGYCGKPEIYYDLLRICGNVLGMGICETVPEGDLAETGSSCTRHLPDDHRYL